MLAKFDALVQRAVNAAMFAMMRTFGWTKAQCRWYGFRYLFFVAGFAWALGALKVISVGGVVVLALVAYNREVLARRELKRDERADSRGLAREPDVTRYSSLAVAAWNAVFAFLPPRTVFYDLDFGGAAAAFFILVLLEYAKATPPTPPAKPVLQLARSAA